MKPVRQQRPAGGERRKDGSGDAKESIYLQPLPWGHGGERRQGEPEPDGEQGFGKRVQVCLGIYT